MPLAVQPIPQGTPTLVGITKKPLTSTPTPLMRTSTVPMGGTTHSSANSRRMGIGNRLKFEQLNGSSMAQLTLGKWHQKGFNKDYGIWLPIGTIRVLPSPQPGTSILLRPHSPAMVCDPVTATNHRLSGISSRMVNSTISPGQTRN